MTKTNPVLYDSHMHTTLCKHAVGTPGEYAAQAQARGLKGIILTCHNPVPKWGASHRMDIGDFDRYLELVEKTRFEWAGVIDVRLGIESDFAPGMEDWLKELHARAPFDYILGSVHPHVFEYNARFWHGNAREFIASYFEHLALAAESGLFDSLAHPDLIKNEFPEEWDAEQLLPLIGGALDRIAASGCALELNTSGLQKVISEMNPGPLILAAMHERGIPVVIGSDAHSPGRVAADFEEGLKGIIAAGYKSVSFFLDRSQNNIAASDALNSLVKSRQQA